MTNHARVLRTLLPALVGLASLARVGGAADRQVAPHFIHETRFEQSQVIHLSGRVVIDHPVEVPEGVTVTIYSAETIELTGTFEVRGGGVFSVLSEPNPDVAVANEPGAVPAAQANYLSLALRALGSRLDFSLARPGQLSIAVLDVQGRSMLRIPQQEFAAGLHQLDLRGYGVGSGMYFYRIEAEGITRTGKLVLTR